MSERISLADVARLTGHAVSTVSMALRHDKSIPRATRDKIEQAAKKIGYHPNPLLAALAGRHFKSERADGTSVACFYFPSQRPEDDATIRQIHKFQKEHARKLGYRAEFFKVDDFRDGAHATRVLYARGIQGIILPSQFQLKMLPGMDWNRFCIVAWGEIFADSSDSPQPLLYRAVVDHFALIVRAWRETQKRGYRRIGFALFPVSAESMDDQLRLGAIHTCLREMPVRSRAPLFFFEKKGGNYNVKALSAWVRRNKLDAVIGFNDLLEWALKREGFKIPGDLGFVSLHIELHVSKNAVEDVAGMKEMRVGTMLAALELLDQQMRHHQYGLPKEQRTLVINSDWIDGKTLPDRNENGEVRS